jgi:hypothetical protein
MLKNENSRNSNKSLCGGAESVISASGEGTEKVGKLITFVTNLVKEFNLIKHSIYNLIKIIN